MADLPASPDLEQLRRQAKELLRAARNGDAGATERIGALADQPTLAAAQLGLAREYGFASWTKLKREVERREILDARDAERLSALLAEEPELATATMEHWCDHPKGASPLGYTAMLRYDTARGVWRDVEGSGALARVLLAAGAPVDGEPGERETPLITAANSGGTALLHATVFGMTDVVDVLVAAGARVNSIEEAAAAGDVGGRLDDAPADARLRALVLAADHQRVEVIDQLVAAGVPVDASDAAFGGHPLRSAAWNGRPASVRRLLEHGADPNLRDDEGRTPLDLSRTGDTPGHREAEAILARLTEGGRGPCLTRR